MYNTYTTTETSTAPGELSLFDLLNIVLCEADLSRDDCDFDMLRYASTQHDHDHCYILPTTLNLDRVELSDHYL